MQRYYNVNGVVLPAEEATLKVNDLAILRGYGIFDFFLVWERVPLFIEDYLDRFYRSARLLNMEVPVEREELKRRIGALITLNKADYAGIRLVMTGGYTDDSYTPVAPNLIVMHHPYKPFSAEAYEKGVKLMTHEYQRDLPEVKTTNYAMGIRLLPALKAAGALEPLYHSNGTIKEAVRSNFYIIDQNDKVITADEDILMGITRKQVLASIEGHYEVERRFITLDEVWRAKEAFLTGSNKGVIPITRLDDHVFGDGKPGAVTREITRLFNQHRLDYVHQHSALAGE